MESPKPRSETVSSSSPATPPTMNSCWRKKSEGASLVADVRDHIHKFIHASMDEHKTCLRRQCKRCLECQRSWLRGLRELKKSRVLFPHQTTLSK